MEPDSVYCRGCAQRTPRLLAANAKALELWSRVQTQWRTGFCGVTGLDYNALYRVARTCGVKITSELLDKLQILEGDTLKELAAQKKD